MTLDRAVNIEIELRTRIADLFSLAKCYHLTSGQITERYLKLFEAYPKDLPRYVKAYASGLFDAKTDELYRNNLTHGYVWQGVIYTKWEGYPAELKELFRNGGTTVSGHYWSDTLPIADTAKPYFIAADNGVVAA